MSLHPSWSWRVSVGVEVWRQVDEGVNGQGRGERLKERERRESEWERPTRTSMTHSRTVARVVPVATVSPIKMVLAVSIRCCGEEKKKETVRGRRGREEEVNIELQYTKTKNNMGEHSNSQYPSRSKFCSTTCRHRPDTSWPEAPRWVTPVVCVRIYMFRP